MLTRVYRVAIVLSVSLPAMAWTGETGFTPEFAGATGDPAIAFDGLNRLHVIFAANMSGESVHLYHKMFDGITWTAATDLPGPNYKEPECAAVFDGTGVLHVVGNYRVDNTVDTPYTVFYWSYNGAAWSGPTMLSSGQGGDSDSCKGPRIAVDRNNDLHVVWTGSGEIMYRKRQSGTWLPVYNMTSNSAGTSYGSVSPDIAVDRNGNNVHVVWHDDFLNNGFQAYYTRNTNLGDTSAWWPKAQWFQLSAGDYGKGPQVYLDSANNPHVFWIDRFGGTENVIGYRRWTGAGWTSAANWGAIDLQGVAFDGDNRMRIAYKANGPGTTTLELWHRTYDYTTGVFGTGEMVSVGANTLKVDYAAIAVDYYGYTNLVWQERKGDWPGVGAYYYSAQALPARPPAGPSGTLAGVVRDQYGAGVSGVRLSTSGGWGTVSGSAGVYSFTIPVGTRDVSAVRDFYTTQVQSVTIVQNQTLTRDFVISGLSPASLVSFSVEQGNTSNQLSWTAPTSANLSALVIRCKTGGYPSGPADGVPVLDQAVAPGNSGTFTHAGITNGTSCYYAAFTYFAGASRYYAASATGNGTPAGPADLDRDGDVDQSDFGLMQACLTGDYVISQDPACTGALLDGDLDVDGGDVDVFVGCYSGPGALSNPGCNP